ncbi:MAG: hypothetical protein ACYC1I_11450 [Acidimicrobiales bacterium]
MKLIKNLTNSVLTLGIITFVLIVVLRLQTPAGALKSEHSGLISILSFLLWLFVLASLMIRSTNLGRPKDTDLTETGSKEFQLADAPRQIQGVGSIVGWRAKFFSGDRRERFLVSVVILISIAPFWGILRWGPLAYGDWGYFSQRTMNHAFFPFPPLWTGSQLGTNNFVGSPQYVFVALTGFLSKIGVNYAISERLLYFLPAIVLLTVGIYRFCRRLNFSPSLAALGVLLATSNTYYLSILAGGWETQALATALLPWMLAGVLDFGRKSTLRVCLLLTLEISVSMWMSPPIAYVEVIAVGIFAAFMWKSIRHALRHRMRSLLASATVGIALNGFWLWPFLTHKGSVLPAGYTSLGSLRAFSFQSVLNGLTASQPAWPKLIAFSEVVTPIELIALPVLLILAMPRDSKYVSRAIGAITVIYLGTAALSTGGVGPFSGINDLIFRYVPGASLFRNPVLYLGFVMVSISVLSISAVRNLQESGKASNYSSWECRSSKIFTLVNTAIALLLVTAAYGWIPTFLGHEHQNLSPSKTPQALVDAQRLITSQPPGGVLWIPATSNWLDSFDTAHPLVSLSSLESAYQSATGILPSGYASPTVMLGEPSTFREVTSEFNICYVALDNNPQGYRALTWSKQAILHALSTTLSGFPKLFSSKEVVLYKLPCEPLVTDASSSSISHSPNGGLTAVNQSTFWNYLVEWPHTSPALKTRTEGRVTVRIPTKSLLVLTHLMNTHPASYGIDSSVSSNEPFQLEYRLYSQHVLQPIQVVTIPSKRVGSGYASHEQVNFLASCVSSHSPVYKSDFLQLLAIPLNPYLPATLTLHATSATRRLGASWNCRAISKPSLSNHDHRLPCKTHVNVVTNSLIRVNLSSVAACTGTRIIFFENYDSNWKLVSSGHEIPSKISSSWSNSFTLARAGLSKTVYIVYASQHIEDLLILLAIVTVLGVSLVLVLTNPSVHRRTSIGVRRQR